MIPRALLRLGPAAVLFVALAVPGCSRSPGFVARITVENPTRYDIDVEVAGVAQGRWLPLGLVLNGGSTTVEEVIDQGERWIFRFHFAGVEGGRHSLERNQLVRDRWRVVIPPQIEERFMQLGLSPSPARE